MFVFPANDDGYRKRKRAHKACEQCKRRRKRCDFPLGSKRCEPCEKANILCSLAPEFELAEKASRLDDLAQQQPLSAPQPQLPQPGASGMGPQPVGQMFDKAFNPLRVASAEYSAEGAPQTKAMRPTMGPRATSYNAVPQVRSKPLRKHKRTSSHSPGMVAASVVSPNPSVSNPTSRPGSGAVRNGSSSSATTTPSPSALLNDYSKQSLATTPNGGGAIDRESIGVWVKGVTAQQRLNPHLYTYLASINAFSMPLRPNREALIALYCESIHPVLPLLDRDQFIKLHNIGQAPTLLLHAVLLAAARHPEAAQYLGHQSVRQFCATTAAKIRALLYAEVEQDRLTLVRIYALLWLHAEGPDGLENSCSDMQKAAHYAISLGIHHERPFVDKEELCKLWWSVWCMDRINACVNARPIIINLEDVGIKVISHAVHPKLAELVTMCMKIERVIYLYRPNHQRDPEPPGIDLPFAENANDPFTALLGLLHHTAIILAHKRGARSLGPEATDSANQNASSNSNSPADRTLVHENIASRAAGITAPIVGEADENETMGVMYTPLTMMLAEEQMKKENGLPSPEERLLRQLQQQQQIQQIPQKQNKEGQAHDERRTEQLLLTSAGAIIRILNSTPNIAPLPLVPYCASLTLTVFLRTYPRPDLETGYNWKASCLVLEKMADRWWVAGAMGSMGWNVFKSLEEEEAMRRKEAAAAAAAATGGFAMGPQPQPQTNNDFAMFNAPLDAAGDAMYTDQIPMEEQFLNMFSDLPNQTSFLDQAITLEPFSNVEPWLQEKK
ncbi:hypothetical protein TRVA0_025S02058 [Trichomonascus vanleenenianus]|uniref:uncharacterized protein n=1 Tax=Trichomonascus vanleenenianus TaxID=2268995 RepID=UPI003ECB5877